MYVRDEVKRRLCEVRRLIFDFDGVLVQSLHSFRRNIVKVVDYYFLEILGLKGKPCLLIDLDDVQRFKDTGLFNNDWNLTYAAILYYLSTIFRRLIEKDVYQNAKRKLQELKFISLQDFLAELKAVGIELNRLSISVEDLASAKESGEFGLESFLELCDSGDPEQIKATLVRFFPEPREESLELASRMIPYDIHRPDLLRRLFEESFLGGKLFRKFYHKEPFFDFEESFMEREEFIPTPETLRVLAKKTGKFAIYSERSREQALYHLRRRGFLEYFEPECLVFIEDISTREDELRKAGIKATLSKPDPTLFLELVERCVPEGFVAYIGDSVSDLLTVVNARKRGADNVYFFGVLSSSPNREKLANRYMELGADIITYDVNELAVVFRDICGGG
ncbi:HAD family hydrolase [Candidatus Bathyarchaeota archaeon]|nr:HAD family hydrolase [Candidatus Bathyarchaeota archaeon]